MSFDDLQNRGGFRISDGFPFHPAGYHYQRRSGHYGGTSQSLSQAPFWGWFLLLGLVNSEADSVAIPLGCAKWGMSMVWTEQAKISWDILTFLIFFMRCAPKRCIPPNWCNFWQGKDHNHWCAAWSTCITHPVLKPVTSLLNRIEPIKETFFFLATCHYWQISPVFTCHIFCLVYCIIFWGFTMNNDHFLVIPFVQKQPQPTWEKTRTGRCAVHDGRPRKVREATRDCDWFDRDILMDKWLPSGKHTKNHGKSPFLMGKSNINGHFQ